MNDQPVAYTPETAPRVINWWVIGGALVVVATLVVVLKRK